MIEEYWISNERFYKSIERRDGTKSTSNIPACGETIASAENFDKVWLMLKNTPTNTYTNQMNLVDLFCGTGPMSLGVVEAGRCLGIDIVPRLAIDFDKSAALNYKYNFPSSNVINDDISLYINGKFGEKITQEEKKLLASIPSVDILIGGPPCQGHSDLNNHTRRDDPRNKLILYVTRFAEIAKPNYVIIENVQGIRHDKHDILQIAIAQLKQLGYIIHENLLMASKFGVAQNRRRYILVATKSDTSFDLSNYERAFTNNVLWAISDLDNVDTSDGWIFNLPSPPSKDNKLRLEYLVANNIYELPTKLRPKCQQNDNNRYTSVYGRMYPDKPAPTITSGYCSVGQGRFCHPLHARVITPHEAARIQFIPDYFKFLKELRREAFKTLIGNAVPPKLTYAITLELLR